MRLDGEGLAGRQAVGSTCSCCSSGRDNLPTSVPPPTGPAAQELWSPRNPRPLLGTYLQTSWDPKRGGGRGLSLLPPPSPPMSKTPAGSFNKHLLSIYYVELNSSERGRYFQTVICAPRKYTRSGQEASEEVVFEGQEGARHGQLWRRALQAGGIEVQRS